MSFYPKKLKNCKDLEREKKRIQEQLKLLEKEELMPIKELLQSIPKGGSGKGAGILDSVLGFIPVSNPVVGTLIKMLRGQLAKRSASNKDNLPSGHAGPSFAEKAKKTAKAVAIDFITGYLKWKAIELSYKGIKYYIKVRKEKRAAEIEE